MILKRHQINPYANKPEELSDTLSPIAKRILKRMRIFKISRIDVGSNVLRYGITPPDRESLPLGVTAKPLPNGLMIAEVISGASSNEANKLTASLKQMLLLGLALAVTVGKVFTVTVRVLVLVQPVDEVPVTV